MKKALNVLSTFVGFGIAALAVDDWWESGFMVVGILIAMLQFDYRPSIAESAMRLLEAQYRFMHHLWKEIDREWRPMGGQENEAKRVIVAEIRDTIPVHVQEIIEKELSK